MNKEEKLKWKIKIKILTKLYGIFLFISLILSCVVVGVFHAPSHYKSDLTLKEVEDINIVYFCNSAN